MNYILYKNMSIKIYNHKKPPSTPKTYVHTSAYEKLYKSLGNVSFFIYLHNIMCSTYIYVLSRE